MMIFFLYIFLQLLGSSQVSGAGEHLEKLLQGGEVFFKKSSYGDGFHPLFPTIYLPIQPPALSALGGFNAMSLRYLQEREIVTQASPSFSLKKR